MMKASDGESRGSHMRTLDITPLAHALRWLSIGVYFLNYSFVFCVLCVVALLAWSILQVQLPISVDDDLPFTFRAIVGLVFLIPFKCFIDLLDEGSAWAARFMGYAAFCVVVWIVTVWILLCFVPTVEGYTRNMLYADLPGQIGTIAISLLFFRAALASGAIHKWAKKHLDVDGRFLLGTDAESRKLELFEYIHPPMPRAYRLAFLVASVSAGFALVAALVGIASGLIAFTAGTLLDGVLLTGVGWATFSGARSRRPIAASAARAEDPRPPVLLLRSFVDEDVRAQRPRVGLGPEFAARFEESLTQALWRWGPVIAIGNPDKSARTGAAREFITEHDWRERVSQLVTYAVRVTMLLGSTEGLSWELQRISELGAEDKLVMILPPLADDQLESRWDPLSLPETSSAPFFERPIVDRQVVPPENSVPASRP